MSETIYYVIRIMKRNWIICTTKKNSSHQQSQAVVYYYQTHKKKVVKDARARVYNFRSLVVFIATNNIHIKLMLCEIRSDFMNKF